MSDSKTNTNYIGRDTEADQKIIMTQFKMLLDEARKHGIPEGFTYYTINSYTACMIALNLGIEESNRIHENAIRIFKITPEHLMEKKA